MVKEIMTKAWEISACVETLPKTASGKGSLAQAPATPAPPWAQSEMLVCVAGASVVLGEEQTTEGALEVSLGPMLPRADRSPPHPPTEGPLL